MTTHKKRFFNAPVILYSMLLAPLFFYSTHIFALEADSKSQKAVQQSTIEKQIEHYQRLIKRNPEQLANYNNLAVIYAGQGNLNSARKILEEGTNARLDVATLHKNLQNIYLELSRKDYASALRLNLEPRTIKLVMLDRDISRQPDMASVSENFPAHAKESSITHKEQGQIINVIKNWARAWSTQEVDLYLSFYSDHFEPAYAVSRANWAQLRRTRLTHPRWVSISVTNLKVESDKKKKARVVFSQNYRSSNYSDQSRKALVLEHTDNGWLIIKENTL